MSAVGWCLKVKPMSEKISPVMERALVGSMNAAAKAVAVSISENGIPTLDNFKILVSNALTEQAETLSAKAGSFLTVEALTNSTSKKVNLRVFLGMIKGAVVVSGAKSRQIFDLSAMLKSMAPMSDSKMSIDDAMKAIAPILSSFGTKISSAFASYVAQFGVTLPQVLDQFVTYEETMAKDVTAIVHKVMAQMVDALLAMPSESEE